MSYIIHQGSRIWNKFLYKKINKELNDILFEKNLPNTDNNYPNTMTGQSRWRNHATHYYCIYDSENNLTPSTPTITYR